MSDWQFSYVTTVVQNVAATLRFFEHTLGVAPVDEGHFSAITASGTVVELAPNVLLAIVEPDGDDGPAAKQLRNWRGGLCHVGVLLRAPGPAPAGEPTHSPVGSGVLLPAAHSGGLLVEVLHQQSLAADENVMTRVAELDHVATVVSDLDMALSAFARLGMQADPEASGWTFPDLGTTNAVLPATSGYLELNVASASDGIFGSFAAERGAGIVGLTLTMKDLAGEVGRFRAEGVGVSGPSPVLAITRSGRRVTLGNAAVVSVRDVFGARLFLFEPGPDAPHFAPRER